MFGDLDWRLNGSSVSAKLTVLLYSTLKQLTPLGENIWMHSPSAFIHFSIVKLGYVKYIETRICKREILDPYYAPAQGH